MLVYFHGHTCHFFMVCMIFIWLLKFFYVIYEQCLLKCFNSVHVLYSNENLIKKYQPVIPENQLVNRVKFPNSIIARPSTEICCSDTLRSEPFIFRCINTLYMSNIPHQNIPGIPPSNWENGLNSEEEWIYL